MFGGIMVVDIFGGYFDCLNVVFVDICLKEV